MTVNIDGTTGVSLIQTGAVPTGVPIANASISNGTFTGVSTFSNTVSFSGNTTFTSNTVFNAGIQAAGSLGTVGQSLTSNGSYAQWTTSAWQLINTINVTNGAAIQDTTSLTSTYQNYMIVIRKLLPATNAVDVKFQIYSGGAYQTTNYSTVMGYGYAGGASGFQGTTYLPLSYSLRASNVYQSSGMLYINNVNSTTEYKPFHGTAAHYDTGTGYYWSDILGGAWIGGTGAITGFQIVASSGNITGIVQVYGSN